MDLWNRLRLDTALALILILFTLAKQSTATNNITKSVQIAPAHLSWTSNNTRYDLVFNIQDPIKHLIKLDSDSNNFITNSLSGCTNYSACLFKNGTFLEAFNVNNTKSHESIFTPVREDPKARAQSVTECDTGNQFKVFHYCSTHWNPPAYLRHFGCDHTIEWHSPLRCHSDSVNHEHPCYIYDPRGKLIDLTPWIMSDGSSYNITTEIVSSNKIRDFRLNVCNEAHDACGPNVSSCYTDPNTGLIESGYNNLTSIKYSEDNAVMLTSLGHYKEQCEGDRVKTVIRFTCKKQSFTPTGPKLVRSTACENIIEWASIRACPISDVSAPASECKIKNEALDLDIDIMRLTGNRTTVEIPDLKINGQKKKMLLAICGSLSKDILCEGKMVSTTKACLLDSADNPTLRIANNSRIVGSLSKSTIRLADDRIYLESFAINKTCSETIRNGFNVTQKVGTRLEFFCSRKRQERPTFLGYDDCTYVFEWGTPLMCLEAFDMPPNISAKPDAISKAKKILDKDPINLKNFNIKDVMKSESRKKELTSQEEKTTSMDDNAKSFQPSKMNSAHKYFMITLIVMSFVAFIAVIFILDKKTRLRVTLRQARQTFQSSQQPYSRVVNDLDL